MLTQNLITSHPLSSLNPSIFPCFSISITTLHPISNCLHPPHDSIIHSPLFHSIPLFDSVHYSFTSFRVSKSVFKKQGYTKVSRLSIKSPSNIWGIAGFFNDSLYLRKRITTIKSIVKTIKTTSSWITFKLSSGLICLFFTCSEGTTSLLKGYHSLHAPLFILL